MIPYWAWGRSSTEDLFFKEKSLTTLEISQWSIDPFAWWISPPKRGKGLPTVSYIPVHHSFKTWILPSYWKEPWEFVIEFTPQSRLRSFLEQTNNTHGSKSYTILPSSAEAARGNSREPVEVAIVFCLLLNHCLSSHLSCFHQCLETEAWEWLPTREPLGLSQLESLWQCPLAVRPRLVFLVSCQRWTWILQTIRPRKFDTLP